MSRAVITKVEQLERSYAERVDADARRLIEVIERGWRDAELYGLLCRLDELVYAVSGYRLTDKDADHGQAIRWMDALQARGELPPAIDEARQAWDAAVSRQSGVSEGAYGLAVTVRACEIVGVPVDAV